MVCVNGSAAGLGLYKRQVDRCGANPADFELSPGDGAHLALLHRAGTVLSTRYEAGRVRVRARVPESVWEKLQSLAREAAGER